MEFAAILAELGCWGGQSGSPVWVYFSIDRDLFAGDKLNLSVPNPRLLGLLHGHFDIPRAIVDSSTSSSAATVPLNSGIAIIIPAAAILELLGMDDAVAQRAEYSKALRDEGLID